jgi:hypothetical protein
MVGAKSDPSSAPRSSVEVCQAFDLWFIEKAAIAANTRRPAAISHFVGARKAGAALPLARLSSDGDVDLVGFLEAPGWFFRVM